jgi:hypothetical protein
LSTPIAELDAKRANRGVTPAADSWCEIPISGIGS